MFTITSNALNSAYNQLKNQLGGLNFKTETFYPFPSKSNPKRIVRKPQAMDTPVESHRLINIKNTPAYIEEMKNNISLSDLKKYKEGDADVIDRLFLILMDRALNRRVGQFSNLHLENSHKVEQEFNIIYHEIKNQLSKDSNRYKSDFLKDIGGSAELQNNVANTIEDAFAEFKSNLRDSMKNLVVAYYNAYQTNLDEETLFTNYPEFNPNETLSVIEAELAKVHPRIPTHVSFNKDEPETIYTMSE